MTTVVVEQERLVDLLDGADRVGLRRPTGLGGSPGDVDRTLTWTPDLTANEQILARAAAGAVRLTTAERNALQPEVDLLTTFAAGSVASKTLADVVNATRAQSRILRALLRS